MISINIASIPSRTKTLINTIQSVINQVDTVNLYLNNYTKNPYPHPKVNFILGDNSLTDSAKFFFVKQTEGYYIVLDDDLIVGKTYVQDIIKEIDKYGIVSYHGRTFLNFPLKSYYKDAAIRCRCLDSYDYTEPMQIIGSGCMGFNTSYFSPPMTIFKTTKMSDIYVSLYAHSLGLKTWVLKHSETHIKYQHVENTIWHEKVDDCQTETDVINNYYCK